ncbi:MAG: hypothetical protein H7346_14055 [Burkholderiaceae bacterium]|nr:hypothetical protein [Burkholderiaceae bacterium]
MNQRNPAIVAQSAVRRLPRLALLLFCVAYVLPGFIGREPWKSADISSFGYMAELANGLSTWFSPTLLGQPPEIDALLPYWLGAWAMQIAPGWIPPDFAARIPFGLLLALTLTATWYATYYLSRSPQAQPVAFAFGGEASPADYARAMADGGLLALIASLGLAQLSHETTPAQVQLCFAALTFYGVAATPYWTLGPALGLVAGLVGLSLSGAPAMSLMFGLGSALICLMDQQPDPHIQARKLRWALAIAGASLLAAGLAWALDQWRWRIALPQAAWRDWRDLGRLLLWFTWPAWPLALWTLWRWRRQLGSRHVAVPLWFASVAVATTLTTQATDRSLLLGLPALAALAAFALPTLKRSVAALVDWFTLLFFSGCAIIIWVIWIAMQTGIPRQPAANVARLAPGFVPSFSLTAFIVALAATLAWAWLVKWRAGRHRAAIWKSLVLPAGGAALSWLLLMTLWMPLLDFARSYNAQVHNIIARMDVPGCAQVHGLSRSQITALQYHGRLKLRHAGTVATCPWLIVDADALDSLGSSVNMKNWVLKASLHRLSDENDDVLLFKRVGR